MPYFASQSVRIYWDEQGQGEPILLIMGLGYTAHMWHRARAWLAEHFRTIAFDNRGVGRSDAPAGPYPIALMAADAAAVLDAAEVACAHVFGVSMGGMIAQELALQHPRRVRSLILGATAAGGPTAVRSEPAAAQMLKARAGMTPEQAAAAALPFVYDAGTPPDLIEEDMSTRRPWLPRAESYVAQLQGILAWESYSRLPAISVPTLVIHGENDRLVPAGNGRIIAGRIPGAKLQLIAHASHIFLTDQPQIARDAILNFLKAQSSGACESHPAEPAFATNGHPLSSQETISCSRRPAPSRNPR